MRKHKGFEIIDVALSFIAVCVIAMGLGAFWLAFQEVRNAPETVCLYDNNGNVINQWSSISRFRASDSNVCFEADGHRIIVYGGIVIAE